MNLERRNPNGKVMQKAMKKAALYAFITTKPRSSGCSNNT